MFSQPNASRSLPSPASLPRAVASGLAVLLLVLGFALFPHPALAEDGSVDDLPQAVIDALESVVPGLTFTEISIEEEDDGTEYEIKGTWDRREVEAKLSETGEFLELEIGNQEDDDDNDLPSSIEDALDELLDDPSVDSFELSSSGDLGYYEIQATVAAAATEIRITPTGALLSIVTEGLDIDLSEGTIIDELNLPSAVADTIGTMEVETLLMLSGSQTMFYVEGLRGKAKISMVLTSSGRLLSFELDRDADGISDLSESDHGTDFALWDTDGDLYPDGFELSKRTDPLDPISFPQIVSISSDAAGGILVVSVETFRGADFLLEQCGDTAGNWQGLGACLVGDGNVHEFIIPLVEELKRCFFRIKVLPLPEEGHDHAENSESTSGGNCNLPASLVGSEINIEDDGDESKMLSFKTGTRGEIVESEDGEVEITPFAYSFNKTGECEIRVTLTFSTSDGFETKVFTLTFTSGSEGAYVSQEFENGEPEDPEAGDFRLTMN